MASSNRRRHEEPRTPAALRRATTGDAGEIARIWRTGWADAHLGNVPRALIDARTEHSFTSRAASRLADTIVATRADAIAGFVMIDGDQIDQLYLDRSARGAGVGAVLLAEAERIVLASGHPGAWLAAATGNTAARRFYEHRGWIDDGPFIHQAPVPAGTVGVDCHRFRSPAPGSADAATGPIR